MKPARLDVPHQIVDAEVVEAHAVDDGLGGRQPEQPRFRVAGLRTWRHRADLDEPESQRGQRIDVRTVLVESGGQTYRVGEIDVHHAHRFAHRMRQQVQQAESVRDVEAGKGEAVGVFGIERKEGRAQEWIKHGSVGQAFGSERTDCSAAGGLTQGADLCCCACRTVSRVRASMRRRRESSAGGNKQVTFGLQPHPDVPHSIHYEFPCPCLPALLLYHCSCRR